MQYQAACSLLLCVESLTTDMLIVARAEYLRLKSALCTATLSVTFQRRALEHLSCLYLPWSRSVFNADLCPVSPAEESSDVRVTFKDKHNASSERPLSLAERNKQAQRRHRQRQKVPHTS